QLIRVVVLNVGFVGLLGRLVLTVFVRTAQDSITNGVLTTFGVFADKTLLRVSCDSTVLGDEKHLHPVQGLDRNHVNNRLIVQVTVGAGTDVHLDNCSDFTVVVSVRGSDVVREGVEQETGLLVAVLVLFGVLVRASGSTIELVEQTELRFALFTLLAVDVF